MDRPALTNLSRALQPKPLSPKPKVPPTSQPEKFPQQQRVSRQAPSILSSSVSFAPQPVGLSKIPFRRRPFSRTSRSGGAFVPKALAPPWFLSHGARVRPSPRAPCSCPRTATFIEPATPQTLGFEGMPQQQLPSNFPNFPRLAEARAHTSQCGRHLDGLTAKCARVCCFEVGFWAAEEDEKGERGRWYDQR